MEKDIVKVPEKAKARVMVLLERQKAVALQVQQMLELIAETMEIDISQYSFDLDKFCFVKDRIPEEKPNDSK